MFEASQPSQNTKETYTKKIEKALLVTTGETIPSETIPKEALVVSEKALLRSFKDQIPSLDPWIIISRSPPRYGSQVDEAIGTSRESQAGHGRAPLGGSHGLGVLKREGPMKTHQNERGERKGPACQLYLCLKNGVYRGHKT